MNKIVLGAVLLVITPCVNAFEINFDQNSKIGEVVKFLNNSPIKIAKATMPAIQETTLKSRKTSMEIIILYNEKRNMFHGANEHMSFEVNFGEPISTFKVAFANGEVSQGTIANNLISDNSGNSVDMSKPPSYVLHTKGKVYDLEGNCTYDLGYMDTLIDYKQNGLNLYIKQRKDDSIRIVGSYDMRKYSEKAIALVVIAAIL